MLPMGTITKHAQDLSTADGNLLDKQAFAEQVIALLEKQQLELATPPNQEVLALAAYNKLQYDFPLLSVLEINALAQKFSESLNLKSGWFPYSLSPIFVSNIVQGARGSKASASPTITSDARPSAAPDAQSNGHTQSTFQTPPDAGGEVISLSIQPSSNESELRSAYQGLCATVFIQLIDCVLSLADHDSWRLLAAYCPAEEHVPDDWTEGEGRLSSSHAHETAEAPARSPQIFEEHDAAQEDEDDCLYEPMEVPVTSGTSPSLVLGQHSYNQSSHHQNSMAGPCADPLQDDTAASWDTMQQRILHLGSHTHYSLLSDDSLWRDSNMLSSILKLLRTLGVHSHSEGLQPLVHVYVSLLSDRLAACPSEITCLEQVWDALGVKGISSMPRPRRGQKRQPGSAVLPAEATLAFTLIAHLAGQVQSAAGKGLLWGQVNQHMLPVLERCLEDLTALEADAEVLAAVLLAAQVTEFYVAQRPGHFNAAAALSDAGIVRSLAVLMGSYGYLAPAEPLRCAALLSAASSPDIHKWFMAVPAIKQMLASSAFQAEGVAEAHGAVWEMLGSQGSSPLLTAVLEGCTAPTSLGRLARLLQLLSYVKKGCDRRDLWSQSTSAALQKMLATLREASNNTAVPDAASTAVKEGCSNSSQHSTADIDGAAASDSDEDDSKSRDTGPEALVRRRARQLRPLCMKLLKELLTTGGKTD